MLARSLVHHVLAGAAVADMTALFVVDLVSWHRTRSLRAGRPSPTAERPPSDKSAAAPILSGRSARASPTTFLAGLAGLLAMGYGLTEGRGAGWAAPACVVAGALIGVTGLAGRVRVLEVDHHGLVVHYAARPPWHVPWTQVFGLRAPSSPMGGWRLVADGGSRMLMPSDLLSNEWLLTVVIEAAGLSFAGRRWERPGIAERLGVSRPA